MAVELAALLLFTERKSLAVEHGPARADPDEAAFCLAAGPRFRQWPSFGARRAGTAPRRPRTPVAALMVWTAPLTWSSTLATRCIGGGTGLNPQSGIGKQKNRDGAGRGGRRSGAGISPLPGGKETCWKGRLAVSEDQDDLDRRVGLDGDSVEGAEGEDLARAVLRQQLESRQGPRPLPVCRRHR